MTKKLEGLPVFLGRECSPSFKPIYKHVRGCLGVFKHLIQSCIYKYVHINYYNILSTSRGLFKDVTI